jgi:hypothetical protein
MNSLEEYPEKCPSRGFDGGLVEFQRGMKML